MKKNILICIISLFMFGNINVFAEREATVNTECNNIYISGEVSDDIPGVTIMLKNDNEIAYMNQVGIIDGKYELKFKFNKNYRDYKLYVRDGKTDITDTVISTSATSFYPVAEITKSEFSDDGSTVDISAYFENKYNDEGSAKLIIGWYDENGIMNSCEIKDISYDYYSGKAEQAVNVPENAEKATVFILNSLTNCIPLGNSAKIYTYADYQESALLKMTNVPPTGVSSRSYQGVAIYDEYVVQCYDGGYVNIFDLDAQDSSTPIAVFKLASFNDGSDAMRPEGEQLSSSYYRNHCNQVMFGTDKWDENDPFPLLYVTAGNQGAKMKDGSYIVKCAVERITYDEATGQCDSQLVQQIEFNDTDFVDEGTGADGLVTLKNGKFTYSGTDNWQNTENYEVPTWGWPAYFVDSDPTASTENKFYIHSARFRTGYSALGGTANGNYADVIENFNNEKHNAYIITQFSLPELPESEAEFGKTVTLTPADIENQFTTDYDIGFTQGGTMYQGRIYYPFGCGGQPGQTYFNETRNAIRVYDIDKEKIISRIELWKNSSMKTFEPECCAVYNGKLVLNYNASNNNLWMFDYIENLNMRQD